MNRNWRILAKRLAIAGTALGATGLLGLAYLPDYLERLNENRRFRDEQALRKAIDKDKTLQLSPVLPTREEQLSRLEKEEFDILIIGGGATGCGLAVDAVSRGLRVALVERGDFASQTSSKSTKLIHGGVRYLQKAIMNLDFEQYRMVREALNERGTFMRIAPHITTNLPIMLPVYKWYLVPYYWLGIKAYDIVSGSRLLKASYYLSKQRALECFPMLKRDQLVGAIIYYDGQQDDARMCATLGITAAKLGACVVNYTEAVELRKSPVKQGDEYKFVLSGAIVRDALDASNGPQYVAYTEAQKNASAPAPKAPGKHIEVRAKCVINATGPFTDRIRTMDNPSIRRICQPSSGVHIVLPDYYSPRNMGLLDPSTSDGRVIFFLPWMGCTMAGTTDTPCAVTDLSKPTEGEVKFILNEIRNYLSPDVQVRRGDVLSAWSGIRPLVMDPSKTDTQSLARNHIIEVSDTHLITIAGGKWTTYRSMAQETIDEAIDICNLQPKFPCRTEDLLLDGSYGYSPTLTIRLVQDFGLETDIAAHLASTYGDKAMKIARLESRTGKRWPITGIRLHNEYPYVEGEVKWACREYAQTAVDVLARRTRLAFLNVHASFEALPRIIELMAEELKWDKKRRQVEYERAVKFLKEEMGLELGNEARRNIPLNFTSVEVNEHVRTYREIDSKNKGFITVNDLRAYFKRKGQPIAEDQLHDILNEVDTNRNGEIDLGEYLQFMSALKSGNVSYSRLASALHNTEQHKKKIAIDRSGGGV